MKKVPKRNNWTTKDLEELEGAVNTARENGVPTDAQFFTFPIGAHTPAAVAQKAATLGWKVISRRRTRSEEVAAEVLDLRAKLKAASAAIMDLTSRLKTTRMGELEAELGAAQESLTAAEEELVEARRLLGARITELVGEKEVLTHEKHLIMLGVSSEMIPGKAGACSRCPIREAAELVRDELKKLGN